MVWVYGVPSPDPSWHDQFTKATPTQTRAAAWIAALVANPGKWLPKSLWANREIRAFVPARYWLGFDRSLPDLSKLPYPARKALSPYLRRHACLLTTAHTRAFLQAFADAGIAPYENHAFTIAFGLAHSTPQTSTCPRPFQTASTADSAFLCDGRMVTAHAQPNDAAALAGRLGLALGEIEPLIGELRDRSLVEPDSVRLSTAPPADTRKSLRAGAY